MDKSVIRFNDATVGRVLREEAFATGDTKVSRKAVALAGEYLAMFTREAVLRSNEAREAGGAEDDQTVDTTHLATILGLLVMDF